MDTVDTAAWDSILLATGTEPVDDNLDATAMLCDGDLPNAEQVAVFGETETGMFAALWLAENGKRVTLTSPADLPGIDSNDMERDHLSGLLEDLSVKIATYGEPPTSGTTVWARPRVSSTAFAELVDEDRVRSIGTRFRGGRMFEATQSGFWAGARLGGS
jgi:hypothetical protein